MLSKNPSTFDEAVEVAEVEKRNERVVSTSFETFRLDETKPQSLEMNALAVRLNKLESLLSKEIELCEAEQAQLHSFRGRWSNERPVRCYVCHKFGHVARKCSNVSYKESQTVPKQVHTTPPYKRPVTKKLVDPPSEGKHEETELSEAITVHILDESCPILECKVNNCLGKFLVDTGSKVTLMRRSVFDRILQEGEREIHERVRMSTKRFVGITGDKINV